MEEREQKDATWIDEPILVAPYDPAWPSRFAQERRLLLVGVESLEASRACFASLDRLEYLYAPYLPSEMHWFCKPHPSRRTHRLHLVPIASPRYRDELTFRDLLRARSDLTDSYAALKRRLADRFEHDREAYTEAKSSFIQDALKASTTSCRMP